MSVPSTSEWVGEGGAARNVVAIGCFDQESSLQ